MKLNRIRQLLATNRKTNDRPNAKVVQENDGSTTVYIYEAIVADRLEAEYWGGISAAELVPQLRAIQSSAINVRIDSPGGDVFAAQAIATALQQHKATVTTHIDGLAASAATMIAIAADRVVIASGAFFMIHRAWSVAWGNANDMLAVAALLEKVDGSLADQYAAKTGKDSADMLALMDAETWMTAQEALDAGFVDALAERKAQARAWDLSAYANAPKTLTDQNASETNNDMRQRINQRIRIATICQ